MPLPPPPLGKLPLGLLGFLAIKNGGKYPQTLAEWLQPTWDLERLYRATNATTIVEPATQNVAAVGFQGFSSGNLTVPAGEVWLIDELTFITGNLGAGQALQFAPALNDPTTGATLLLGDWSLLGTTGDRLAARADHPIVALSGTFLGIQVSRITAGPIAFGGTCRYARMPV